MFTPWDPLGSAGLPDPDLSVLVRLTLQGALRRT